LSIPTRFLDYWKPVTVLEGLICPYHSSSKRVGLRPFFAASINIIKYNINNIVYFIELYVDKVNVGVVIIMENRRWIDGLSEEDLAFLKRFILASGSLKDLAQAYCISYPTVRLRLDRLIEKVKVLDSDKISSEFERLLRTLYAEGRIEVGILNAILAAHRKEMGGEEK